MMCRILPLAGAALALAACSDPTRPPSASSTVDASSPLAADSVFTRYVALGTSNSMGVQSAGISAAGQRAAWPAQLAARIPGVAFSLPLVQDPGCNPPLVAPLAADIALVATFGEADAGNELVQSVMTTCEPLQDGITLPTNSVAISGANVHDALFATPESATVRSARVGTLYSRVLAPGETQVTAMLAQRPTFVSVELAANEVLPASRGDVSAMTPYADWERDYDSVVAAVRSTGARAVLVGLPADAANFPSIRHATELFDERAELLRLGIVVSPACASSSNYLFIPGYLLTLLSRVPTTATCADVAGTDDFVLTPDDMNVIDARMARMNAHIQAKANEGGYAYFTLGALYDLPKPAFSVHDLFFSNTPFGPDISLDGVHPSASGQTILADSAAQAIAARYGLAIP
jgi:hypothetical protein